VQQPSFDREGYATFLNTWGWERETNHSETRGPGGRFRNRPPLKEKSQLSSESCGNGKKQKSPLYEGGPSPFIRRTSTNQNKKK